MEYSSFYIHLWWWWYRCQGRLSHWGSRPMSGVPSVGVFLRDPSPYLCESLRKTRKTPNGQCRQARPGIEPGTSRLQVLQRRTAQSLVGPRTDNVTSMPQPGFEPRTFIVAAGFPNHCTAWSAKTKREEDKATSSRQLEKTNIRL